MATTSYKEAGRQGVLPGPTATEQNWSSVSKNKWLNTEEEARSVSMFTEVEVHIKSEKNDHNKKAFLRTKRIWHNDNRKPCKY